MTEAVKRILCAALILALLCCLPACGGQKAPADLERLYSELTALGDKPEMIRLADKKLQRSTGVDPAVCPQAIVAVCGDGLRVDEIWLIQAADEASAEEIQALAESRAAQICSETENYLPDQYAVARDARTLRIGSYVGFFLSPAAAEMESAFRKAVG